MTSSGRRAKVFKVNTSPAPSLTLQTTSSALDGEQDPGFFTSISSNGRANPIIWAVSRSVTSAPGFPIYLYAFDPKSGGATMTQLFKGVAGTWPSVDGNSNIVPLVANGHVFVASYKQLQAFGMKPAATKTLSASPKAKP